MSDDPAMTCTPHPPPAADGSPRSFDPAWRTETVSALATGIEAERAFDRLPILADALEEAGCDDELLLRHCRECDQHEAGCWVIALTLDLPSGAMTQEQIEAINELIAAREQLRIAQEQASRGAGRYLVWAIVIGALVAILKVVGSNVGKKQDPPPAVQVPPDFLAGYKQDMEKDAKRLSELVDEGRKIMDTEPLDVRAFEKNQDEYEEVYTRIRSRSLLLGVTMPEPPPKVKIPDILRNNPGPKQKQPGKKDE